MTYFSELTVDGVKYDIKDRLPNFRCYLAQYKVLGLTTVDYIDWTTLNMSTKFLGSFQQKSKKPTWEFVKLNKGRAKNYEGILVYCNEEFFLRKLIFLIEEYQGSTLLPYQTSEYCKLLDALCTDAQRIRDSQKAALARLSVMQKQPLEELIKDYGSQE